MKNRWGSYEDYCHEINEEAERAAHEAGQCNEVTCIHCIEQREELDREEADKNGYYDSKGHWTK